MRAQDELREIYRLEDEAKKHKLKIWNEKCNKNANIISNNRNNRDIGTNSPNSITNPFVFTFENVDINGYVFSIDEEEMLEEFEDDDQIVGKII